MHALAQRLEALLFICPRPVPAARLSAVCQVAEEDVSSALAELREELAAGRHGIELREVAGGYTLAVLAQCADDVRRFAGVERPDDLSPAAMETLAVVAYLEPVTRAEVAEVRGVSSEWALRLLEERGLVEQRGRGDSPGAPILYGTSQRFLTLFGLKSRNDLPALEEFALRADEVEQIRQRLHGNAERRGT